MDKEQYSENVILILINVCSPRKINT